MELRSLPALNLRQEVSGEGYNIAYPCSFASLSPTPSSLLVINSSSNLQHVLFFTLLYSIIYLGDSGVSDFTAILSPSQAAVLTIGSIKLTPGDASVNSKSQQAITVTLTADARVYHDELVCRWLDEFKRTIESPEAYGLL